MNLLEYEAKNILDSYDIAVPKGIVVYDDIPPSVTAPCVVKSQVPVGGRGKAGGVRVVKKTSELKSMVRDIKSLEIKGFIPTAILVEELVAIRHEYYLSLMVDRSTLSIQIVAHRKGGIDVEEHEADEFYRRQINPGAYEAVSQELADYFDLPEKAFVLGDLIEKLYNCFVKSDALLLEINPLILAENGVLIAGDCKLTLDSAAGFRHKEWDFTEKPASANFVTLDKGGNIATIANGAGLAMATVDAVKDAGLTPANFLDIGGNATTEGILDSFNQLVKFNNLTNIVINIFGGIVRCDTVARAIIEARRAIPSLPTLQIRLSGTNSVEARALLEKEGLVLHDTLESCLTEIRR